MTKQEVKDEHKDIEGNPEIKKKVKQAQYDMTQRRMMEAIPDADVVITNPTHYAVALKYDQLKMSAPIVVGLGADDGDMPRCEHPDIEAVVAFTVTGAVSFGPRAFY